MKKTDIEAPVTRGRRPKHMPEGRTALLDAALKVFAQRGYAGADLRSIARDAKVDASLVRVHFGSKENLWRACVDMLQASLTEAAARLSAVAGDTALPVVDRLKAAIGATAEYTVQHPEHREFIKQHAAEMGERAEIVSRQLVKPIFDSMEPLIAEGIRAGVIRAEHPALYFCLLVNALHPPPGCDALMSVLAPEIGGPEKFMPALLQHVTTIFVNGQDN
ncbi:TetR/AcrR family transcriptional regulator [Pandoraea terrae]|uniref:TetR/AcrR family transcriptional regulator n=1 Tax=Pandoraea terrae TaxID=1537710 RepID=UPI001782D36D|nr:TetR/AcrR family transcriptional regulator [Pandoraea terrae]